MRVNDSPKYLKYYTNQFCDIQAYRGPCNTSTSVNILKNKHCPYKVVTKRYKTVECVLINLSIKHTFR